MAAAQHLPRRRPASPSSIDALTEQMKSVAIQKGSTFQVSNEDNSEYLDPFLKDLAVPGLPTRSATCPKALEDLLIGAGERRAVDLLKRVDEAIAKRAELSKILTEPEVLPVPRFMVENATIPDDTPSKHGMTTRSQIDKDSGIGSSIITTSEKLSEVKTIVNNNTTATSAVTRSYSGSHDGDDRCLSDLAQKQVHKFIIQPILREESLKEFHPLIKDVPKKIGNKDIRTLRDLEKTLIFLAPDFSTSPSSYRKFCEVSIRCLHLTVNGVHESDRCLPSDRPYTTNYFVDLIEQIRRYASILAATRERQARGEESDEMDATTEDRIELKGGVTHNGQPAFLVVRRGSKHINLADGQPMDEDEVAAASVKRTVDVMTDDEDAARRSMARRKKNEPIKTYYCKQAGCTKHFKRPCDLTKHIKTHERPWKCPEVGCKYHELGWPTEKERERHFNDKHSDTPTLYKCLAPDCSYTSKRESNCKQHMEKAHDIQYVRSKNNGKGKAVATDGSKASTTRLEPVLGTPSTADAATPEDESLPDVSSTIEASTSGDIDFPSVPFEFNPDFESHFNTDYLSPNADYFSPTDYLSPTTPSWTEDRQTSIATSVSNYSPFDMPLNFEDTVMKTEEYDFTMFDNYQVPTPQSFQDMPKGGFGGIQIKDSAAHTDAGAQEFGLSNHFSDAMASNDTNFNDDFQLYTGGPAVQSTVHTPQPMFPDPSGFNNMGSQFNAEDSQGQTDLYALFPELNSPQ